MQPEVAFAIGGALADQEIGMVDETLTDFPLAETVDSNPLTERLHRVDLVRYFGPIGLAPRMHLENQSKRRHQEPTKRERRTNPL